jgi:hypothetical protein
MVLHQCDVQPPFHYPCIAGNHGKSYAGEKISSNILSGADPGRSRLCGAFLKCRRVVRPFLFVSYCKDQMTIRMAAYGPEHLLLHSSRPRSNQSNRFLGRSYAPGGSTDDFPSISRRAKNIGSRPPQQAACSVGSYFDCGCGTSEPNEPLLSLFGPEVK